MICRMGREFDKLRFRVFLEYKFMQHRYVTKYSMFHIHFTLSLLYISTYLLYRFRFVHMLLLETCKPKFLVSLLRFLHPMFLVLTFYLNLPTYHTTLYNSLAHVLTPLQLLWQHSSSGA